MDERTGRPVAIIEPVGGHGGMHYYDFGLAEGLAAAGVATILYTCDETDPAAAPVPVRRYFRGVFGAAPRPLRAARYLVGLVRSLADARRNGARTAHFHLFHANLLEWCGVAIARLAGFRIVVTAHDVESFADDTVPALAARIYRRADLIIAHNRASRDELERIFDLPPERTVVIPHGNYHRAAAAAQDVAAVRARLGLAPATRVILFFGQIKRVKGLDLLLEALPEVVPSFPDIQLVIAGKIWKDDFDRYRPLLANDALRDRVVTDLRFIPDELAADYLQAAELVVLPYRRIYQSGVLLMAMTFGRAVLVSDLPAMLEIVEDGRTGFVFRQGDAAHLAQRLREILADPDRLSRVAAAGRQLAESAFDWGRIGRLTRSAYDTVAR